MKLIASMEFVFIFLPLFGLLCGVWLKQRKETKNKLNGLEKVLREREKRLESTSQLLIAKNIELSDQNIRLQKLLEAKSDFVGIASHQMRTPITEIKWGLEYFLTIAPEKFTLQQRQQIEKIIDSTRKMIELIDDLLRLVRIEAGYADYKVTGCNLEAMVQNIVGEMNKRFPGRNFHIQFEFQFGETPVPADAEMINIVLANLIENAYVYTPSGGTITLITSRKDNKFYFAAKDTGISIPQHKRSAIFKKFQRGEVAMEMYSRGIGLGLYIAKNIIENHGGEIGFESQEGKGSTFYFTLPLNKHT